MFLVQKPVISGYYLVSSPEATAMDLILYPKHGAGINNVLTVLVELAEKMDAEKLLQIANASKETAWIQHLGYMLEFIGEKELSNVLYERLKKVRVQKRALLSNKTINKNDHLDEKWKIIVNAELEADL